MAEPRNRQERLGLELPLSFKADDLEIAGRAVNVSASGMLVRLDQPVELWINGEISLTVGEYYVELQARVARMQDNAYGLSFLIRNENDSLAIGILVDFATSKMQGAGEKSPRLARGG